MKNTIKIIALCMVLCLSFCACAPATGGDQETTEQKKEIMQKEDPKQDDTINLLMIGNSFCYYYTDELYGMAEAAGIKMRVCNIYYSGCTLEKHWEWWKNGESNYEFTITDENGRTTQEGVNLEYCLQQYNWDFISLQGSSGDLTKNTAQAVAESNELYYTELFAYLKEQYPQSQYLWHQTWAYQIGYDRNNFKMENAEQQKEYDAKMLEYSKIICEKVGAERVNTGEAWSLLRLCDYDNLCARKAVDGGIGDYYHDGDIGGGQYLNACVWFETITGQNCMGNTFRPVAYTLDEAFIGVLQKAAHTAVETKQS